MIFVEMNGRLGNQMFRYAFARWLQIQGKEEDKCLILDYSIIHSRKDEDMPGWEDSLKYFRTVPYQYYCKDKRVLKEETSWLEKMVLAIIVSGDRLIGDRPLIKNSWRKLLGSSAE